MALKKNVGLADRILRFIAGIVMSYLGSVDNTMIPDQVAALLLGILGIIFLLTAIFSLCPFYNLIGLNTCSDSDCNEDKDS